MHNARRMSTSMVIASIFAAYIYVVVKVILFKLHSPEIIMDQLTVRANLIPFHEIVAYFEQATLDIWVNFAGNILIFMPFGMLLPLLLRGMSNPWSKVFMPFLHF
ncbi:VanZ family protein [Paenibacillus chitinolyticus]|uniref:VanZ family protein n=1 Tax=Paenibacillus chitinolyticus TaxID=79263 RepID=UPI00366E3B35